MLIVINCSEFLISKIVNHRYNLSFRSPYVFYLLVHSRSRGFLIFRLITHKHTPHSVGPLWTRNRPVEETSTWQHKHCTRQTSKPPVGFEPTLPTSARPQTYALDRAVTGIDRYNLYLVNLCQGGPLEGWAAAGLRLPQKPKFKKHSLWMIWYQKFYMISPSAEMSRKNQLMTRTLEC
jgi:hypothetical protein